MSVLPQPDDDRLPTAQTQPLRLWLDLVGSSSTGGMIGLSAIRTVGVSTWIGVGVGAVAAGLMLAMALHVSEESRRRYDAIG